MPFINEMLEQTQRRQDQASALACENVASDNPVQRHLQHQSGLHSRFRFDVEAIMASLREEILGQDAALQLVQDMLQVIRADITDPRRPLFVALFLGPTGVGKTEIVRALARALHGDADAFCRVDMNTLSQEHYAAALTGAPPGYVGAKEGTTLLDQDKLEGSLGRPGIVLFDELEKASVEVTHALLNVFDNGMLTVASGERTYSFRNSLIFMTSNLAAREIQRYDERRSRWPGRWLPRPAASRHQDIERLVRDKLIGAFAPEFVNRIDSIVTFNWIEQPIVEQLVALELRRLNRRLTRHHCQLELEPALLQSLARSGFDRQFGARSLRRSLRSRLEVPLAQFLLDKHQSGEQPGTTTLYLARLEQGRIGFIPL
ncbi:AAA family ATPase [Pseudomonas rubra]|uniref:AAA family ATPase n=1 Tax=Pseudomonas rubra TaxID=2942627 RepID=A0ABT5PCX9_9PSED|nr:AAA family ATPase [Pseudomonas rubra]MDD1015888.1 AAA family ATPase [Pseudomonas rubra]MDD1040208.1 AAA family ATPase [Pseudomonas rubra]MDD1157916.1 AAA family ATPase [Pseudomonas rubra]